MKAERTITMEIVQKYTTQKVAGALAFMHSLNLPHSENMEFLEMAQAFTNNVVGIFGLYRNAEEGTEKREKLAKVMLKLLKPRPPKDFIDEVDYINRIIKKIQAKNWNVCN